MGEWLIVYVAMGWLVGLWLVDNGMDWRMSLAYGIIWPLVLVIHGLIRLISWFNMRGIR